MKILAIVFLAGFMTAAHAEAALKGPLYFKDTPSQLPLDCRVELNRVVKDNCSHAKYVLTSESLTQNNEAGFGKCEAEFKQGYAIVQWDVSPGFGKSFSLVGLDCP